MTELFGLGLFGLGLGLFGSVFGLRLIMPRVMRDTVTVIPGCNTSGALGRASVAAARGPARPVSQQLT